MKKLLITLIFLMLVGIVPTIAQEEIDPLGDPVIMDSSGTGHTYHSSYDWLGDPSTHNIYGSSFYRYSYYPYGLWNPYGWYSVYTAPSFWTYPRTNLYTYRTSYPRYHFNWNVMPISGSYSGIYLR